MIKEEFRNGKDINTGEVPEDLVDCVQQAADLCPVQIIHVDVKGPQNT